MPIAGYPRWMQSRMLQALLYRQLRQRQALRSAQGYSRQMCASVLRIKEHGAISVVHKMWLVFSIL